MSRTKQANPVDAEASDRLRKVLGKILAGEASLADIGGVGADARLCAERLERVRARGGSFAGIEFSEDMQKLLKLVGKKKERMRFSILGKAAAL
jgi:hypothetical protein